MTFCMVRIIYLTKIRSNDLTDIDRATPKLLT